MQTMKKKKLEVEKLYIQESFQMDLNSKQKGVLICPGEEKLVLPILAKKPVLLKKLMDEGKVRERIYEVMGGQTPGKFLEWYDDSFRVEFPLSRPREEIIHIIKVGKSDKFLSVATLHRLKVWLEKQPQAGGAGAKIVISAIDSQIKALGGRVDEYGNAYSFENDMAKFEENYYNKELTETEKEK